MPIPALRADGFLPVGIHSATLDELLAAFPAVTARRQALDSALSHLVTTASQLSLGSQLVLDGSYLSGKAEPDDIDGALLSRGANETVTLKRLGAAGVDLTLLDLFVVTTLPQFERWIQFFSNDRLGNARGVVVVAIQ